MIEEGPQFWIDPRQKKRQAENTLLFTFNESQLIENHSARTFEFSDSKWLRDTIEEYQIGPGQNKISGHIALFWPSPTTSSDAPVAGSVEVSLKGVVTLECVRCLNPIEVNLDSSESYELAPDESQQSDYFLSSKGIALDALLVDALECALPTYPQCSGECSPSQPLQ